MPAYEPSPPSIRSISRRLSSTRPRPACWSPPVGGVRCTTSPVEPIPTPDDVFGPATRISVPSSPNLAACSPNLAENRDPEGCLISEQLSLPVVDDLEPLSEALRSRLEGMASEPRAKGKVDRQVLIDVVLQLCEGRFLHAALPRGAGEPEARHSPGSVPQDARPSAAVESCFPQNSQPRAAGVHNCQQAWRVILTAGCEMLLDGGAGGVMVRGILQLNAAPLRNLPAQTGVARD